MSPSPETTPMESSYNSVQNMKKEKRRRGRRKKIFLRVSLATHRIPFPVQNSKPQNCLHCCWLLCLSPAAPLPCHRLPWPTLLSTAREFIPLAEMSQSLRCRCVNWWISVSVALFQPSLSSTSWSHHPLSSPFIYEPGQVFSPPSPVLPVSPLLLHQHVGFARLFLDCDNVMFAHLFLYKE